MGPGPVEGVFLRYPGPYLRKFWRNLRKTLNGQVDKRDRGSNWLLPFISFEDKTALTLVGLIFEDVILLFFKRAFGTINLHMSRKISSALQ